MVDFRLPPDVQALRDELRAWLAGNLTDEVRDAARRRGRGDDDALAVLRSWDRTMADAGWGAVSWPVEYGGRGATALEQLVFTEETIAAGAPTPVNVIGINNIAPAIMEYGTERQKRELLPRMVRADDIWCQGMSEPDAGSDLASLRTRAVRDGDDFVVTGQKTWTSNGHRADWCALFVRTNPDVPKHRGISCLVVDMRSAGIEARPLRTLTGDTEFAEVFFDDVRVPASALLGPLDGGWAVATSTLSHERAGAARLYAMIRLRLHDLVGDLRAAEQRGLVEGDDPLVLARLGELDTRLAFLAVLCQRSISAPEGDASGSASLAKTVWGELEQDVAALGHDVLGGHDPGGRWSIARLSTRSLTIAGGTTQVNKNVIALRVLGLPPPVNLDLSGEQVALRDTVRRALAAEAPPDRAWERLAGLGALDVLVPGSRGGSGLGMVEAAIISEEMGRALYAGPWLASAVAAVRAAAAAGAPFVPGGRTAAVALPWPGHDAGFALDAAGRVTGAQDHVLSAPLADVLLLPAARDGEVVLVAVEGVEAAAEPGLDATTLLGTVTVEGAGGDVLGSLPDGALDAVRDDVLVTWAADALGAARAVLALAVEHAKVRHQFGQPIGAFQAVQHLLVDALETVELVAGGVLRAAWAADAGDPDERHLAALRLKAFAGRLAAVGDIAIQVLGGIGYTWEHDAHRYLRRLLGWSVAFGPAWSYQVEVGRRAMMTPLSASEEG